MSNKTHADIPLLGTQEAAILEHILSLLHDRGKDLYLNPRSPVDPESIEALLSSVPELSDTTLDYQTIRALGASTDDKSQAMTEEKRNASRRRSVNLLASFRRPFALSFSCNDNGIVDFCLGIENDPDGFVANCYLSACFGYCEYVQGKAPSRSPHVWSALCRPIRCNVNDIEGLSVHTTLADWADAVAAAIIETNCCVQLSFIPVDKKWVQDTLKTCLKAENAISSYLKRQPQVSVGFGQGNITSENERRLLSIKGKSDSLGSNATMSMTISENYTITDTECELYATQLRHKIRLLQQASEDGWFVRLEVGSDQEDDPEAEVLRALLASALLPIGFSCRWVHNMDSSESLRLSASAILPAYLLPALISFPTKPFVGFKRRNSSQLELTPPNIGQPKADSLELGSIIWDGADTNLSMNIPRREMNRHAVVFGMTGSGKTNTVCSMLSKLDDLNYMIIEPVKGEYHVLPDIHRFNMEVGSIHSLNMNPFWFPQGAKLQYHIDSLKLIISSAFDLYAAMPNILEQCLYRVYSNCGWDIVSGENLYRRELPEENLYPTFQTLCAEINRYLNESAFEGETAGNYRGALLSRLQSFTIGSKGMLLNTNKHIDFKEWSKNNIVVELDALADDADKAIVMGALLVQYFEYIKGCGGLSDRLKHLFVLEEAHHLFRETPHNRESNANASSQLVSMLNNLLAEIRAYGEGFIIVDQSPSSISTSVLKNTAVKIVHRVDYGDDIKLLQSALLLHEGDNITASLAQGEALVRFGAMQAPAWVHIPHYPKEQMLATDTNIDIAVSISDNVCRNDSLIKQLYSDSERILNTLLIETDREIIDSALIHFKESVRQWVAYFCGLETIEVLTNDTYVELLDLCIANAVEKVYPDQFCLQSMIRMFVRRLYDLAGDAPLNDKLWKIMKDYRHVKIHMRSVSYYRDHADRVLRGIIDIVGTDVDIGVLNKVIDGLWVIPKSDTDKVDEAYSVIMQDIFYEPLSEYLYAQYKLFALRYCLVVADNSPE